MNIQEHDTDEGIKQSSYNVVKTIKTPRARQLLLSEIEEDQ